MKTKQPEIIDTLEHNLVTWNSFRNRYVLHDMSIKQIIRKGGNVIMVLERFVLVFRDVIKFEKGKDYLEEDGDCWLYDDLERTGQTAQIKIQTFCGDLIIGFRNLRVINPEDYSILIPDLDGRLRLVN